MSVSGASWWVTAAVCLAAVTGPGRTGDEAPAILNVTDSLFDTSQPDTLGLSPAPGLETVTVYRPGDDDDAYSNGAVIAEFAGRLYVQWQTSRRDEDAPDTHVVYSVSENGREWSAPLALTRQNAERMTTSGGWWVNGGRLVAYVNRWQDAGETGRGGSTLFRESGDGFNWSEPEPVLDASGQAVGGIFEQDPKALPDGRIIGAIHEPPGLTVSPWYTDDASGVAGWTRGSMQNLPFEGRTGRAIEPSWYLRGDGAVVMVFRDQAGTYRKLASVSTDRGVTWSTPRLTNMPDARTKQSAGNLPDGTSYLVGNPVSNRARYPLVLALSRDGFTFGQAWLLRAGGERLPPVRIPGRYKRAGYHYPKSAVIGDSLYIAYATGKEDIEVSRVPLAGISGR